MRSNNWSGPGDSAIPPRAFPCQRCLQELLEAVQVRGGPPLEQPGHQRDVDDLGKRDVLGPFGSTRRNP
jgi:hypothetical protein